MALQGAVNLLMPSRSEKITPGQPVGMVLLQLATRHTGQMDSSVTRGLINLLQKRKK